MRQLQIELPRKAYRQITADVLDDLAEELLAEHEPGLRIKPVRVSQKMWKTLGRYTPDSREIVLSARLLEKADDDMIFGVVRHEVAHAITGHRFPGARAHGKEFREVCREIGADASATTDMGAGYAPPRSYFGVACPRCGVTLWRAQRVRQIECRCGAVLEPEMYLRIRRPPPDPDRPEEEFYSGDLKAPVAHVVKRPRRRERWKLHFKCAVCGAVNRRKRMVRFARCSCGVRLKIRLPG